MRHKKSNKKLGRASAHRMAMFHNMANSLIKHEQIVTTLPKAKELRRIVEPLITLAKAPSVHTRRLAFARLGDHQSVAKLFDELGPRFEKRPGGYMRVLKYGYRRGDNAPMAFVQLLDRPEGAELEAILKAREAKRPCDFKAKNKAEAKAKAKAKAAAEKAAKAKAEAEAKTEGSEQQ